MTKAANSTASAGRPRSLAAAWACSVERRAARIEEARAATLRPLIETWAAQYAALLDEARQKYGDGLVDGMLRSDPAGKTVDEQYSHVRNRVRFQTQIAQLQSKTLETLAGQLDPDAAKRLLKLDKIYYYARLKP